MNAGVPTCLRDFIQTLFFDVVKRIEIKAESHCEICDHHGCTRPSHDSQHGPNSLHPIRERSNPSPG